MPGIPAIPAVPREAPASTAPARCHRRGPSAAARPVRARCRRPRVPYPGTAPGLSGKLRPQCRWLPCPLLHGTPGTAVCHPRPLQPTALTRTARAQIPRESATARLRMAVPGWSFTVCVRIWLNGGEGGAGKASGE